MKTFTSIIALLAMASASLANPVPEAAAVDEAAIEARADQRFSFWTNTNYQGNKGEVTNPRPYRCFNMVSPYDRTVSSAGPTSGLVCTLFENLDCQGASVTIRYPGQSNLASVNFNDRARSYQCADA